MLSCSKHSVGIWTVWHANLDAHPEFTHRRFPQLDFGTTGGRMLTLRGATLLHVAAEYVNVPLATLLLDRGADVNIPAFVDDAGVGGQTPIFHAVTQFNDAGMPRLFLNHAPTRGFTSGTGREGSAVCGVTIRFRSLSWISPDRFWESLSATSIREATS